MAKPAKLRSDLAVTSKEEKGERYHVVTDPYTGESFEFGEQEWFLLQSMDGGSTPDDLIAGLLTEYDAELTHDQLKSFVDMVTGWGLLDSGDGTGEPGRISRLERSPQIEPDFDYNDLIVMPSDDAGEIIAADRPFRQPGSRSKPPSTDVSEVHWVLFNPERFLSGLAGILPTFHGLRYVIPVLIIIASTILFNNLQIFIQDFFFVRSPLSIIQILVFGMFTINLLSQLSRGYSAVKNGVESSEFGIKFVFGVLPRFAVSVGSTENLTRKQKLDVFSSALLVRLTVFSLCTMFWLMSRSTGTLLPALCLMLMVVAAVSFFLAANPLYNSDGYKLLTTVLDMPGLKQKANLALFSRDSVIAERVLQEENQFALRAYALSSIIFLFVLLGAVLILSARWFELNYQGTGVVIYLVLLSILFWRFYSRFVTKRKEMKDKRSRFEAAMSARNNPAQEAGGRQRARQNERTVDSKDGGRWSWLKTRWTRRILLIVFVIILFLPYPYETGGELQVLPDSQNEIYAETPGVITRVLVKSGEFIPAGTRVAALSYFEQEKNLLATQASILEQQAKLEQLRSTPTAEDIELARSRLNTARTQFKYTSESARRLEALVKDGNVSLDDYQDKQKQMEVDRKQVDEAQANLNKVIAGPHPKEIEAAEFELKRLQERLKYDEQELERTNLLMPMDGRIVTKNLDHMVGQYLDEGDHFVTVENDERVRIEIKVPESDIADVAVGADARFKVWAHGDELFHGKVSEIAPTALEETYGKVVVVTLVIPNTDNRLKSGMTGFGKVDGGTKLVIVAFTRMLVRFFTIEMWSWIP